MGNLLLSIYMHFPIKVSRKILPAYILSSFAIGIRLPYDQMVFKQHSLYQEISIFKNRQDSQQN